MSKLHPKSFLSNFWGALQSFDTTSSSYLKKIYIFIFRLSSLSVLLYDCFTMLPL